MSEPLDPNNGEEFKAQEPNLDSLELCSEQTKQDFRDAVVELLRRNKVDQLDVDYDPEYRVISLTSEISVMVGIDELTTEDGAVRREYFVTRHETLSQPSGATIETDYLLQADGSFTKNLIGTDASQALERQQRNAAIEQLPPDEQSDQILAMYKDLVFKEPSEEELAKKKELQAMVGDELSQDEAADVVKFLRQLKKSLND